MSEFIVARNPDRQSRLPYLVALPLAAGVLWLKAADTWPRASRVYCHPVDHPPVGKLEIVERVPIKACIRLGPAIDLVLDRGLLRRSQFIFTESRVGRALIFWQTPKTVRAAKPGLRVPSGRARTGDSIFIDTRERYGYTFTSHAAPTTRRPLPVGDYAAIAEDRCIAVVERKTITDFATSLVDGSLTFRIAELATLPAAAVAVEGTYSALLRYAYTRAGLIPELISRLLIRYPNVSINFLESRKVAEEWTYRFLVAAYSNAGAMPLPTEVR